MSQYILTRRLGEELTFSGRVRVEVLAIRDGQVRLRIETDDREPVRRVELSDIITEVWHEGLLALAAKTDTPKRTEAEDAASRYP